ncbi:tetratricopeptide repeat protein [Ekhidna sp.]
MPSAYHLLILRSLTILIICSVAITLAIAQDNTDSLWRVFNESDDLVIKVETLNSIAYSLRSSNPDSTLLLAEKSERMAQAAGYRLGIADAKMRAAIAHTNLGNFYRALQLYLEAQSTFEELNNNERVVGCTNNIGRLYNFLGDHDRALEYYEKAVRGFNIQNDPREGNVLNNIGYIHKIDGNYDLALDYLRRAWAIAREINDPSSALYPIYNIGSVYVKSNNLDSAKIYLDSAISLSNMLRNQYILSLAKIDQGKMHLGLNQISNAETSFKQAYNIASKAGLRSELRDAARYLADVYEMQNRLKEALQFHKTYKSTNDSLFNNDLARRIAFQEAEYEYNQLQIQQEIEQERERLEQENELEVAILIRNSLIAGLLSMFVITYLLFVNYKRKRKDHEALQKLNIQIEKQSEELQRANHEIIVMNNNLEKVVNKRTEQLKIRNQQLKEYLSSNSHIVRAPLARILGLVDLYDPEDSVNLPFINESLQESATELDNALRSINEKLSDEQEA